MKAWQRFGQPVADRGDAHGHQAEDHQPRRPNLSVSSPPSNWAGKAAKEKMAITMPTVVREMSSFWRM